MAKRRPRKKVLPVRVGTMPTLERCRQWGNIVTETLAHDAHNQAYRVRARARDECALDTYRRRLCITDREHEAGLRFRAAYLRCAFQIGVADHGNPYRNEVGGSDTEARLLNGIVSERRLRAAYGALSPQQKTIVIAVCGHDQWAGDSYRLQTLQRGLKTLAKLWRIV